jgi:hypothetical protein
LFGGSAKNSNDVAVIEMDPREDGKEPSFLINPITSSSEDIAPHQMYRGKIPVLSKPAKDYTEIDETSDPPILKL